MVFFKWTFLSLIIFTFLGCGSSNTNKISNNLSDRVSLGFQGPALPTLCDPLNNPTFSGITVSGSAAYEYRPISVTLGEEGLREVADTPKPIRGAEFVVENGNKQVVFCGFTDSAGQFSFNLPQNNQFYKLIVRSRDEHFANVMRAPETNDLYELEFSFTANSNKSDVSLVAEARNSVIAGAFNILDQVYESILRIQSLTSSLICNGSNCQDIDGVNKADIYWEAGFNPGSYITGTPVLSFFSRDFNRVFILGGTNGDTDFSDTDHFDNSIIIHEYFHFLESNISGTNSPGGPHNGNQLLDPRLAWSEGAAQFFQALVTTIPAVLDTIGNVDGATSFFLNLSVEHQTNDIPLTPGEGEFREFSVTRTLWDLYDDAADSPFDDSNATNANLNFFERFWTAFTGNNEGFRGVDENFRSSGLLHKLIEENKGSALENDWKNVLEEEKHMGGLSGELYRQQYAQRLISCGSGTALTMSSPFYCNANFNGSGPCVDNSSIENHHIVQNSDFYHLIHPGGNLEISFFDSSSNTSGVKADLDIYIYREGYAIDGGSRSTPFGSSTSTNVSGTHATSETETVNGLPAGEYLIQIFIRNFAATSSEITYAFTGLCPEGP